MPSSIKYAWFTILTMAAVWLGSSSARADILFAGDDGDDNGTNIWEFDTTAGGWSKIVFCGSIRGVDGLISDRKANLYESNCGRDEIFKFTLDGKYKTFATLDSLGAAAAFDNQGNLFVPQWNGKIVKLSPDGNTSSVFASNLGRPIQVVFDGRGELFAGDQETGFIYMYDQDGTRTTFASGLTWIIGLAFDRHGILFVADTLKNTIYKFAPDGTRTIFTRNLTMPAGLAFDSRGNLFASDGRGEIYKFLNKGGTLSTKPILFATGLRHDYFITIMPGSMPFATLLSKALAKSWMWFLAVVLTAVLMGLCFFLLRRKCRRVPAASNMENS